jgi:hypothetical protein
VPKGLKVLLLELKRKKKKRKKNNNSIYNKSPVNCKVPGFYIVLIDYFLQFLAIKLGKRGFGSLLSLVRGTLTADLIEHFLYGLRFICSCCFCLCYAF